MALDLGPISVTLNLDTKGFSGPADEAEKKIDGLVTSSERLSKQKLDVAPTGGRELDGAAKSADGLSRGLDKAGRSADKVKAPTGVSKELDGASRAADGLASGLDKAGAASGRVKAPTGVASQLDAAASSSSKLAAELDRAGNEASELGGAGKGIGGFEASLSGLATTAKGLVPALGAAAAGSAALTKGWDRLTSIDNAQFKLQGLGHTTESTADIMNSAMESVSGTAYGFGDAASLAAGTVAATGASGEELTQILGTVADTAAISGRSLGDMGLIFNQVASSGTLMGDDLNQLMDSGIPVLQMLGDELGVTAAEVKDLASEGEVSFEQFESAMRNNMGGAAKEMGASVTGALSNVGAAIGRLGAEAMSGGFGVLPGMLTGVTSGIDTLTSSVTTLSGWFDEIPGPIKAMAAALLVAKAGTEALNTDLGKKLVDNLKRAGTGAQGMGKNVVQAFRDMGTAYQTSSAPLLQISADHRTAADAAKSNALTSTDAFETIDFMGQQAASGFAASTTKMAGHVKGFGGAVKSGVGSVVNALGGPLNLALAGAGLAIAAYTNANNAAKEAQEALAESVADSAEGQKELYEAVRGTTGALDEQGLTAAARVAKNEMAELVEMGEAYSSWMYKVDTDTNIWERMFNIDGQWEADKEAAREVKETYESLEGAMEKVGISKEQLDSVVAEGGNSYNALISALRSTGDAADNLAADQLEAARKKIVDITSAAQDVDPAMVAASDAIDLVADSAGDADKMLGGMVEMLKVMGLFPEDTQETYFELAESVREIAAAAEEVADAELGALGAGLFKDDGSLDETNENAAELMEYMSGLGGQFRSLASEGEDMHAVFGEHIAPALEDLQHRFQLTDKQVQSLSGNFSLMPEVVETIYQLEGADQAVQDLGAVWGAMFQAEEGVEIEVGVLSEGAVAVLEALGYELDEVTKDNWEITVDSAEAYNNLGDILQQAGTFEGVMYALTGTPHQIQISADDVTEETRAMIEEMDGEISQADWKNQVYVTFPEGSAILAALSEIGVALVDNLDGTLTVDAEDVDEAKARLDELDIAAEIIDGRLVIDSNDEAIRSRLIELGWASIINGELVMNSNIPSVEENVRRLEANSRGLQGNLVMSHNAIAVRDSIVNSLQGLETFGTHHVNQVSSVIDANARLSGSLGMSYHPLLGGYTGGRFNGTGFDNLPGYAAGDRHDGYRLPGSGPGTDTTDGFLALDQLGMPIARLDSDEWVVNGSSSEKYSALLAAINADNRDAIISQVLGGLPGLNTGGTVAGGATAPEVGVETVDTGFEGVDASTSVLDHAAMLGQMVNDIPTETTTTVTLTAEGVADELAHIGQRLEPLGEGETITLDAVGDQAMAVLDAVGVQTRTLPDGDVEITATGSDALDTLAGVSDMLFEVGDTVVNPVALLDATELEVTAQDAQTILDALDIENPTPYASIIIDDLLAGKGIAQGELEFLASMVPTPATDLNNALLQAGVSVAESELQRVGNQKATSVVDVNNQSALTNVQATLDALNRMPVERTIRIVASGSAASSIAGNANGGRIPGHATGGRLPTTGPGTDTTDGILGIGSDGLATSWVDAGEWVITKSRSEKFNRTLGAINSGKQQDILAALKADMPGIQGLQSGGVVSPEQLLDFAAGQNVNGQQAARSLQGAPYVWGGVNWGDCSGAMAGLANFAVGMNAFASRFATGNQREATAAMGFRPGLGDPSTSFNLGWFNGGPWGGHTAGDIGGTPVEMGGGAGGQGKIGGAAASASSGQFTDHAHLTLGELWAFDRFQSLPNLTERYQPAPDPNWQTEGGEGVSPGGLGLQIANGLGGGVSHTGGDGVHLNNGMVIPYEGGRLYDTGGDWATGTWGFNDSGATERVLTGPEREDYINIGEHLPGAVDAMYEVAGAVGGLHPELRRMVDGVTPQVEAALGQIDVAIGELEKIADADSVEGITARATAGRVLDFDLLPYSSEMSGMLDAEAALSEARAGQAERAQAIADSEQTLAEARAELEELRNTDPGMSVADSRKLADAEEAVSKARADGDAEKVADAEQKLARAREDVAENTDESAIKRQEDIAKANETVTKSENDLVEARREQVEALEHIVLPDTLGGFIPQLGAAAGALSGSLPQVATALTGLAATAMPAGLTLGMALSAVQVALDVAREIYSIVDDLLSSVLDARTAASEAMASSMSAISEWTNVVEQQRQTVSSLQQAVVRANMDMVAAQWEVRTAQLDVGRAQLEGVRSVAEAEAALQAERERQAKANWWNTNDLSLAYDRLRWAQHDVAYGQLEDYAQVTPEILALQREVLAAELAGVGSVHSAQLASLQASFGLAEAQKLLSRGQRDLNLAMEEYNRMSGTNFGLTVPEATVAERIAALEAEKAGLAGERDSLGTRVSDAFWNIFDMSGDGKFFGLIDVPGSQQRNTYDDAIAAKDREIAALMASEYAPDWDEDQRREADDVMRRAAGYYQIEKDELAEALIQSSIWGEAQRAIDEKSWQDQIADYEQGLRDEEDAIEDLWDTVNFEELAQPMRELIAALEAGANSAQYSADALREQNPAIRAALEQLAQYEGGAAQDIAAGRPPQNVTIIGENFSAEQVQAMLDQLANNGQELNVRVEKLEQPDRPTARDVMASRR